jgi:hypothetical protein
MQKMKCEQKRKSEIRIREGTTCREIVHSVGRSLLSVHSETQSQEETEKPHAEEKDKRGNNLK